MWIRIQKSQVNQCESMRSGSGSETLKTKNLKDIPSKRVMSSPLEHKTIFFSEFRVGDLMLYVATKFN